MRTVRRTDLPHVTDLLKGAGLIDTAFMTEYGRDRGTAVHLAIALLHDDDLDEETLDPAVAAYLPAYKAFLRDARPDIKGTEVDLENKDLGYCGTADLHLFIRGREGILDVKLGSPSRWHQLQLSGYTGCTTRALARWNLYLRDDGTYRLVEHKSRGDWPAFKAVVLLSQWAGANP